MAKPEVKKPAPRVAVKAAGTPTVLDELVKVTKLAATKGEEFVAHATRVCEGVAKLTDEEFGKLSEGAQKWFNAAAEAINGGKAIPEPAPVAAAKAEAAPKAKIAPKAAPKAETKPAAKVAPKVAPKAAAAKTEKAAPKPKAEGVAHQVRSLVVGKPDIEFEAVAKKVGVEAKIGGHAWNIFNEAKRVMELVTAQAA